MEDGLLASGPAGLIWTRACAICRSRGLDPMIGTDRRGALTSLQAESAIAEWSARPESLWLSRRQAGSYRQRSRRSDSNGWLFNLDPAVGRPSPGG